MRGKKGRNAGYVKRAALWVCHTGCKRCANMQAVGWADTQTNREASKLQNEKADAHYK